MLVSKGPTINHLGAGVVRIEKKKFVRSISKKKNLITGLPKKK